MREKLRRKNRLLVKLTSNNVLYTSLSRNGDEPDKGQARWMRSMASCWSEEDSKTGKEILKQEVAQPGTTLTYKGSGVESRHYLQASITSGRPANDIEKKAILNRVGK